MCYVLLLDVDSSLLSSAIILLSGATAEETLQVLSSQDFTVTSVSPGQLLITPPGVMASIAAFQEVLRSVAYFTTRQM